MVIAVQIAAIVKKVLQFLLSNEKGRKFLGYVIGIAIFIVLIPLIPLVGLFGWMSEGENFALQNNIIDNVYEQYLLEFPEHTEALEKIKTTFDIYGVGNMVSVAQMIYISTDLPSMNESEDFYFDYVHCFTDVDDEKTYIDNITETFGILFSDEDIEMLYAINSS